MFYINTVKNTYYWKTCLILFVKSTELRISNVFLIFFLNVTNIWISVLSISRHHELAPKTQCSTEKRAV